MKSFIYNLLSKGLLLAVLIAVAAGYYYREQLFPKWYEEKPAAQATVPAPVTDAGGEQSATESVSDETGVAPVEIPAVAGPGEQAGQPEQAVPVLETQDAASSAAVLEAVSPPPGQEAAVSGMAAQNTVAEAPQIASDLQEEVAASQDEAAPELEGVGVAVADTSPATTTDSAASLALARKAYWENDLEAAVSAYQDAIAADPDNPDAYGELGNLYFAQGDWDGASQAYLDAGLRLTAQGRQAQAARLLRVLGRLHPGRARQLAQELYAARAGGQPSLQ
jgi:tetratricopeptide (TPR) repeat protein